MHRGPRRAPNPLVTPRLQGMRTNHLAKGKNKEDQQISSEKI